MPHHLLLADPETSKDVLTFVGRASRITDEGVRLQAAGGTLALTTAALAPHGLFDQTPTVLAMRIVHADPELECDIVVAEPRCRRRPAPPDPPGDRPLARLGGHSSAAPRLGASDDDPGIRHRTALAVGNLRGRSRSQPWSGEEAVRALRAAIWGEPDPDLGDLPRGVAFAADALGFISGEEEVPVTRSGRWTRLAFRRGHVLARGPVASGLTAVRGTGSA